MTTLFRILAIVGCTAAFLDVTDATAQRSVIDPSGDQARLPAAGSHILFWKGEQQIAGFRNIDKLAATRTIAAGEQTLALPSALVDLSNVKISTKTKTLTVDEYIDKQRVGGLLVLKDGKIVYEQYGLGNNEDTLWVSFSVSKSVVSMLVGAAIQDGYIGSVNEKVVDYLPRLKGSSYDQASIMNIMQMASGVEWNEDYADPQSDVARARYDTLSLYEHLRHKPRNAEPGKVFNYNTAETNLVGTLLRSAIGNNLSTYLSEKIWRPFGMEANANWRLTEPGGGEFGGCCISATLRDYARIGLFALNDGVLSDGTRVLPKDWMKESTTPSQGFDGYGYLWWLNADGSYAATGIFGQGIYINPKQNVVIALHSARHSASDDEGWELQDALYPALVNALSE